MQRLADIITGCIFVFALFILCLIYGGNGKNKGDPKDKS
jgi:hypothetical protein